MLELATFRYQLCRGHPSKFGDVIFAEAAQIRADGADYNLASLGQALRGLLTSYASDKQFSEQLSAFKYTASISARVRQFLTTISGFVSPPNADDEPPYFEQGLVADLGELEVEHIYPQNPKEVVPELTPFTDTLGNLTFWHPDDNKAARNGTFSEKRPLYLESRIHMNKELGEHETWSSATCEERQEQLIARARTVWLAPGGPIESGTG